LLLELSREQGRAQCAHVLRLGRHQCRLAQMGLDRRSDLRIASGT
jgi:hypothetical protein